MGMLIATANPYTLIAIGYCVGAVTGILAVRIAVRENGER